MGNKNLKVVEKPKMVNNQDSPEIALAAKQKIKERDYWLNKLSGEPVKSYFPRDTPKIKINKEQQRLNSGFPPHVSLA